MKKALIILTIVLVILGLSAAWQITACEIANTELQDDMQDLASQPSARIGLAAPTTDDGLRATIVRKAAGHGIELDPAQVTIERAGADTTAAIHLAADYTVAVNLGVTSITFHFNPNVHGHPAGAAGAVLGP
jgi:hypothetical protein